LDSLDLGLRHGDYPVVILAFYWPFRLKSH
jgi:hypothetical protein